MIPIQHQWETLEISDGTQMSAFVARPVGDGDHYAAVIVLQEIWGVNSHIREVANRFARLGYTALAPDIFHRTATRFEAPYSDMAGREHSAKLTREGIAADLRSAHARLSSLLSVHVDDVRIAACGFCMGGKLAFIANALLPLRCAVSFYGGGIHAELTLAEQQHGPLLLFWGGKDTHITREHRRSVADALEGAGKRFTEVNVGHAQHGFFCDERASHDKEAASEAWGMVTAFFASNLDPD